MGYEDAMFGGVMLAFMQLFGLMIGIAIIIASGAYLIVHRHDRGTTQERQEELKS